MNIKLMPHIWTNEERASFVRGEIEKEKQIKIMKEHAENEKPGIKVSAELFLKSKLVNPKNNKFI